MSACWSSVAEALIASYAEESPPARAIGRELPSPSEVRALLLELRDLLFPGLIERRPAVGVAATVQLTARLGELSSRLTEQLYRGLHRQCPSPAVGLGCERCQEAAVRIGADLLAALPTLRALLLKDLGAVFAGDPAATSADEVIASYPCIAAIATYRIAHRLLLAGAAIVPRLMTELAHSETGIDIHPAARIGEELFIDHGTGVVIGATSVIGRRVRIYQGVTLGALSLPTGKVRQLSTMKRHPTIEDDVILYANATILGGDTVIGKGAIIGGNCFITESVPPGGRRSV